MTKRRKPLRPLLLWACVDVTGQAPFQFADLCPTCELNVAGFSARKLKRVRESVSMPTYPSAQWRVVRVEVRVIDRELRGRK